MTVISVTEAARSGHSQEFVGPDGTGYGKSLNRTFLLTTDDANDDMQIVTGPQATALGLPDLGDTYSFGNTADGDTVVLRRNPVRHPQKSTFWTIGIEYEFIPGLSQQPGDGGNFTKVIPEVRFFFVSYEKKVEKDTNGDPITNSLKVPEVPALRIEGQRLALQITQNEPTYDPALAISFENAINSDVIFGGVPPGKAKMTPFHGQRQVIENQLFWRNTYDMQFSLTGWAIEYLDKGFHKSNPAWSSGDPEEKRLLAITDGLGLPISRPILLKDGAPTSAANPSFLTADVFPERAYGHLPLPPLVFSLVPQT